MVKKTTDRTNDDAADVSRVYRAGAHERAPAHLDATILAEARRAVATPPKRFTRTWGAPLATAAVVMLSVALVLFMSDQGVDRLHAPTLQYEAAPAAPAATPETFSADAPDKRAAMERRKESAVAQDAAKPQASAAPLEKSHSTSGVADLAEQASPRADTARPLADIVSVQTSGSAGAYRFRVTVQSADSGCAQYADWWEVIGGDGRLIYRQVLTHSHINDQPFTLDGGPVAIEPDTVVWVRAHMHPHGYGGTAFKGSVRSGFVRTPLDPQFAATLADTGARASDCKY